MTEFSPEIRGIQEAAQHLLGEARRHRKDRHWALPPDDVRSELPEGCVWSDHKEDVRAFFASIAHFQRRVRAWQGCGEQPFVASIDPPWLDEVLEWPNDEEGLPQSERRRVKHLASGAHGALTYRIWLSGAGNVQRPRPRRPRRPRPPRVLPSGSPSLLLTVFRQAPAPPYPPPPEQQEVTRQIQEMERRFTALKRVEDHAIAAEQWDAAAAYRQDRRGLWQELQTLKASLPPPQGLQNKAACQAVTITVGLDKMAPQEQRRWRKRLGHAPRITWLKAFRNYLCTHPQMGRRPIYIEVHTTTEDDITVQVLAYLLQARVVLWEDIEPWVKHYATAWGQETEGKRWDTCLRRTWCEDMLAFALPQEANALRPRDITKPPGTMSLPEVAYAWGMTERQLHSLMPRLLSQQKVSRITKGRFSYIPVDDVERLQDNEDVEAARTRHTAKLQRKKTKPSVSGEERLQAGLTEFDEERLQACIEEFTTRKELATTPEEVQTIMEILEEARKQLRQRQQGSAT